MAQQNTRGRQLRDAVRRLMVAHGTLEEARRPCGAPISMPHAYALLELLHADTPLTVSTLAERLTIDRTNVSRLCARMEADGELEMRAHPEDGRARVLRLTAPGRRLARRVDASSAEHFEGIAATLGGSTGRVLDALERLQAALTERQDEP